MTMGMKDDDRDIGDRVLCDSTVSVSMYWENGVGVTVRVR